MFTREPHKPLVTNTVLYQQTRWWFYSKNWGKTENKRHKTD